MSSDNELLRFMAECLDLLAEYAEAGEPAFLKSSLIQDAVVRRMEVLADAASRLSDEIHDRYPHVPWRAIAGFRNVVAHGYMGVAMNRVWEYLLLDIPVLREVVRSELGS